ncbi:hypothetical protein BJ508DRAFT_328885 [Ascobolus immersus RN42]|uniref:Uncharacterized protein n=1 Tax=Ascobolus immersus RN42 TaxID=1160509 RepID=A0A3N4IAT2_ASCIM|nr:hypothetical protein BJ508DRAFT_328885 [Ascobolus immersus RN42]
MDRPEEPPKAATFLQYLLLNAALARQQTAENATVDESEDAVELGPSRIGTEFPTEKASKTGPWRFSEIKASYEQLLFDKSNGLVDTVCKIRATQLDHDKLFKSTLEEVFPDLKRKRTVAELLVLRQINRLEVEINRLKGEVLDLQLELALGGGKVELDGHWWSEGGGVL